jgi:hypothetical protein
MTVAEARAIHAQLIGQAKSRLPADIRRKLSLATAIVMAANSKVKK